MPVRPLSALLRHVRLGLLGLCLALALSACKVELHSGLNEAEANQIVALLMDAGLSAEKRKDKEGVTVLVEESRFSDAVALLKAHGLPRQSFDTLADIFAGGGIVSSPVEEQARLTHALGQELSQTVSSIDGVLSARVHVVLPSGDARRGEMLPSSASVFIRHEQSKDLSLFVPQIKTLVANSVAGLSYEKVSVALFPTEVNLPIPTPTPQVATSGSLSTSAASTMVVALGLGLLGGGLWLMLRQRLAGLFAAPRSDESGASEAKAAAKTQQVTYEQTGVPEAVEEGTRIGSPGSRGPGVA